MNRGLDDFLRCPIEGCDMRVYPGPYLIRHRCRDHGGPDLPQFRESDPYGNPRSAAADVPPTSASRPLEVRQP